MEDHNNHTRRKSRLAESADNSPYSHAGAPSPHPNTDPYAPLRASALSTLEAMGYDPKTMAERGGCLGRGPGPVRPCHAITPYLHFLGPCFHRVMESYDEFLSEQEYYDMILASRIVPVVKKLELDIKRQVKYPDSVRTRLRREQIVEEGRGPLERFLIWEQLIIAAFRQDRIEWDHLPLFTHPASH